MLEELALGRQVPPGRADVPGRLQDVEPRLTVREHPVRRRRGAHQVVTLGDVEGAVDATVELM